MSAHYALAETYSIRQKMIALPRLNAVLMRLEIAPDD